MLTIEYTHHYEKYVKLFPPDLKWVVTHLFIRAYCEPFVRELLSLIRACNKIKLISNHYLRAVVSHYNEKSNYLRLFVVNIDIVA